MIKAIVRTKLQVWPVLLRANQRLRGYPTQSTDYFFGGNYIPDLKYVYIILLLKAKRKKIETSVHRLDALCFIAVFVNDGL